jgi:TetR/AcrR family transcriptional repressor of nem operon
MIARHPSVNSRQQKKQASRERLLATAAEQFRRQGYAATGINDVTKGAGLTNGAFYAHFDSKQQLLKNTLQTACQQTRDSWLREEEAQEESDPLSALQQYIAHYLSVEHRQLAENGCVVPTLAAEVAREGKPLRRCFEREVGLNIEPLQRQLETLGETREASAWALLALMAGGMMLSRAVAEPVLSDTILEACRHLGDSYLSTLPEGNDQH